MNICYSKNEIKKYSKYRVSYIMAYFFDHIVIKITHRNRMLVFSILTVFYFIQLLLFQLEKNTSTKHAGKTDDVVDKKNNLNDHYVETFNILLLMASFASLFLGWIRPTYFERLSVFLNSIIFSLSFGWLVICATTIRLVPVFYAINVVLALWLLIMDVFSQLYVKGSIKLKNPKSTTKNKGSAGQTAFKSKHKFHSLEDETTITFNTKEEAARKNSVSNSRLAAATAAGLRVRSPTNTVDTFDPEDGLIRDSDAAASSNDSVVSKSRSPPTVSSKGKKNEVDLAAENGTLYDGFRVNMTMMPLYGLNENKSVPRDLDWNTFHNIEHRLDSSSCHIYTAYWDETPVILKLIKADRVTSTVAVAEFDTEENVLSRIRHNNIVQLLGSGKQPRKFLVLELLAGGSLSHALGVRPDSNEQIWARKYDLLETLVMARDLARALNYLHNEYSPYMHILHRDIKPDNIGFTLEGTVKLFDFGLCATVKAQREKSEIYKLTGNTGTLRYMAPEVVLGRSYNQSVDVYSFSILVWQIVTGKVPFTNMGKKQYFDRIVIGGERPRLEKQWPEGFKQLLVDCWQEDKNLRPSFATVVKELDDLIEDEEKLEQGRRERFSHRCYTWTSWFLSFLRPLWLIMFIILFLYSLTIIIRDTNYSDGAILIVFSTFIVYGICLSYLNVWPYVIVHKSHTGNVINGLEISHAVHQHNVPPNNSAPAAPHKPSGAGVVNDNSSVSSTYSKNSNSVSSNVHHPHAAPHKTSGAAGGVDVEMGYSFNPINKVAQRNNSSAVTSANATGGNILV